MLPVNAATARPAAVSSTDGEQQVARRRAGRRSRPATQRATVVAAACSEQRRATTTLAVARRRRPGRSPRPRRRPPWRRTSRSARTAPGSGARPRCRAKLVVRSARRGSPNVSADRGQRDERAGHEHRSEYPTCRDQPDPERQRDDRGSIVDHAEHAEPLATALGRQHGSATSVPTATTTIAKPMPRTTQIARIAARPVARRQQQRRGAEQDQPGDEQPAVVDRDAPAGASPSSAATAVHISTPVVSPAATPPTPCAAAYSGTTDSSR